MPDDRLEGRIDSQGTQRGAVLKQKIGLAVGIEVSHGPQNNERSSSEKKRREFAEDRRA
jgi:hypothetical protein